MNVPIPRLNALFDATLAELARAGVIPTPRESVWLHDLCRRCVSPSAHDICAWLNPVIRLGDVRFYPITVQARMWLEQCAAKWWADDDEMDLLAIGFAMCHGFEGGKQKPGAFSDLCDRVAASKAVQSWAVKLPYTLRQVREAVAVYLGSDSSIELKSVNERASSIDPLDWGKVLGRICDKQKCMPEDVLTLPENVASDLIRNSIDGEPDKAARSFEHEALRLAKNKILDDHLIPA